MVKNFRFWCQKILPLVYDDSISYYELLCSVIKKLNETIDSTNGILDSFESLKLLIENLNLQDAVDSKIDELIASGEFPNLITLFNKHIVDTYGTYDSAAGNIIANNNTPAKINGNSDAEMANYAFWDSVNNYNGLTIIPNSDGIRFTANNIEEFSCNYDVNFEPLLNRFVFLFNTQTPIDLTDCYYGKITSVDRVGKKMYVDCWYKHGDGSGTTYTPLPNYTYGIYNLKNHYYADVVDVELNEGTISKAVGVRETNLRLKAETNYTTTMNDSVVREYENNTKNVIAYAARKTTENNVPLTAFYGGNGVATLLGSVDAGRILDNNGTLYKNGVMPSYEKYAPIILTSGNTSYSLPEQENISRLFIIYNNQPVNCTINAPSEYSIRIADSIYPSFTMLPYTATLIFYDANTSNYNILNNNVDKMLAYGNSGKIIRVANNQNINIANFTNYEMKFIVNTSNNEVTITIGTSQIIIPSKGIKVCYNDNGSIISN